MMDYLTQECVFSIILSWVRESKYWHVISNNIVIRKKMEWYWEDFNSRYPTDDYACDCVRYYLKNANALVQLRMRHLVCHKQFTRPGTRVAICPTSTGCTEGRFAQFWHAWLPLIMHKCFDTLHKQWDFHFRERKDEHARGKKQRQKGWNIRPQLWSFHFCTFRQIKSALQSSERVSIGYMLGKSMNLDVEYEIQMPTLNMGCFYTAMGELWQSEKLLCLDYK